MLYVCLHLSLENLGGITPNSMTTMTGTETEWFSTYFEKKTYIKCTSNSSFSTSFDLTKPYLSKNHVLPLFYQSCARVFLGEVSA